MIGWLQAKLRPVHGLAIAGAWLFVVMSLAQLGWVGVSKLAEPSGTATLLEASAMGAEHQALGLTYDGWGGLFKVFFQLAVIGAAVFMTCLPANRPRRIGHAVLVAWAALWTANSHWLAGLDHQFASTVEAGLLTALLGCTVYRAGTGWRRPAPALETAESIEVELVMTEAPMDEPPADDPAGDGPPMIKDPPAPTSPIARAIDATRRLAGTARRSTVLVVDSNVGQRARAGARAGARRVGGYLREKGVIVGPTKSA